MMRTFARACCLGLLFSIPLAWSDSSEDPEVTYLLAFVAGSGCVFIRNGDEHSSPEAADHLRLKHDRGRRYVDSADDFIDRLASESSWTGKPYTVRCGQTTETSGAWLHRALAAYRNQPVGVSP